MATPLLLFLAALLAPSAARAPATDASAAPTVQVTVGVLLPEDLRFPWARPRVAPALSLALEALQPQLTLDGLAVRISFAATEEKEDDWCDEAATSLKAAELKGSHDPDVLVGMSCFDLGLFAGHFAEFWRLPLLRAGPYSKSGSLLGDVYAGPLEPSSLTAFQVRLVRHFNWTACVVPLFSRHMKCWRYANFFWKAPWGELGPKRPYISSRALGYGEEPGETVRYVQAAGRVAFICLSLENLHRLMRLAHAQNMTNGDYVFFYLDFFGESMRAAGHREAAKPWQSKESNDTGALREAFQTVLVITPHEPQTPEYQHFENQLVLRAQKDFGVAINDSLGHLVAGCYHDGLLLYLRALNETLREGGTKRNTSHIMEKMKSLKIQGVTGMVSINSKNYREMDYELWAMRDVESGEFQVVGHYIASEDRINWTGNILWKKGEPYLDSPPCGFNKDDPSCGEGGYKEYGKVVEGYQVFEN